MRKHKYNAQKTIIDGIVFASKKEATRYSELKFLELAGEITELELQPKFPIVINEIKVGLYIADFRYKNKCETFFTVEDVKGWKTPMYKFKKKIVEALYKIKITEI